MHTKGVTPVTPAGISSGYLNPLDHLKNTEGPTGTTGSWLAAAGGHSCAQWLLEDWRLQESCEQRCLHSLLTAGMRATTPPRDPTMWLLGMD